MSAIRRSRASDVSILIPVRNAAPWVARAIESALCQTRPAGEIIALDDGSTDGSGEILHRYRGRVRIETGACGGQNRSRNRLTASSRGEWLIYLDADDELAPDCLQAKIEECDAADAIYGSMETAWFDGPRLVKSRLRVAADYDDPWPAAFSWELPNTSAFMFRRAAVMRAGQWNESLQVCTDYDLYFRLLRAGARFKASSASRSVYRHWSVSQAVHARPTSRVLTRAALMRRAAEALQASDGLTPERRHAFEQSMLECIRSLYDADRRLARAEWQALAGWSPAAAPRRDRFPALYVLAFRVGGLEFAEALARWSRTVRGVVRPDRRDALVDYDRAAR